MLLLLCHDDYISSSLTPSTRIYRRTYHYVLIIRHPLTLVESFEMRRENESTQEKWRMNELAVLMAGTGRVFECVVMERKAIRVYIKKKKQGKRNDHRDDRKTSAVC